MELLKLSNQLCFPIYNASKIVVKAYRPALAKFGINYLQYLMLLVLFEEEEVSLAEMSERIHESRGSLIPLANNLEESGYVRVHREGDEILKLKLSDISKNLEDEISCVPRELLKMSGFSIERIHALQLELSALVSGILKQETPQP